MEPTVFIVDDDDASIRDALPRHGLRSQVFPKAEDFLATYSPDSRGCLLTDLRIPGLSGLDLLAARLRGQQRLAAPR